MALSVPRRRLVDPIEEEGLRGIALRGDVLEVTVFPEAGGKIRELVHRPTATNLLWRNPRLPLQRTYAGAPFDDVWCGGWDEIFPTDGACQLDGVAYHDHGDLWIGPWAWEVEEDDGRVAVLAMHRSSASLPCLMERWIRVERRAAEVEVRYRLSNLGTRPVRFLWSLHVAHPATPGARLHLPAPRVSVHPPYLGRLPSSGGEAPWPRCGAHDLSVLPPPESGLTELLATRDLAEGWCAVSHPSRGLALSLRFDRAVFPQVWVFGAYGGWRGHTFVLTEPSTGRPGTLADNVASGTAPTLGPGEFLETTVVAGVLTESDASFPGYAA